jgi:hypothetical protein
LLCVAVFLCCVLFGREVQSACVTCGPNSVTVFKVENGTCVEKCAANRISTGYSCGTCSSLASPNPAPSTGASSRVAAPTAGVAGQMTLWTTSKTDIQRSACEYALPAATSKGFTWLVPHINKLRYCGVSAAIYQKGLRCGQCYRITYNGVGGTDPGRAGSAIIQVVDTGSAKEFNCFSNAFTAITGATTGVFPIRYTPVACTKSPTTVVVLDGNNEFYVKVLLAGGTTSVKSATLKLGSVTYTLDRVSGATWKASLAGLKNQQSSFSITYVNGVTVSVSGCFGGKWPVATGTQCSKT